MILCWPSFRTFTWELCWNWSVARIHLFSINYFVHQVLYINTVYSCVYLSSDIQNTLASARRRLVTFQSIIMIIYRVFIAFYRVLSRFIAFLNRQKCDSVAVTTTEHYKTLHRHHIWTNKQFVLKRVSKKYDNKGDDSF